MYVYILCSFSLFFPPEGIFLSLFNYSCRNFPPITLPALPTPTAHIQSCPLPIVFVRGPFIHVPWWPFSFFLPLPLPAPLLCSLFPCLWFYSVLSCFNCYLEKFLWKFQPVLAMLRRETKNWVCVHILAKIKGHRVHYSSHYRVEETAKCNSLEQKVDWEEQSHLASCWAHLKIDPLAKWKVGSATFPLTAKLSCSVPGKPNPTKWKYHNCRTSQCWPLTAFISG